MKLTKSGLMIPTAAMIHGGPRKVFRCSAPGCSAKFYEDEERQRIAHALSHRDDSAIHAPGIEDDQVFGEGDPEKQEWMAERFRQTGSMDPKDY